MLFKAPLYTRMMTDADSDLYTFDEDLGLRTRYFVLSGFREEKSIRRKIEELGGQNLYVSYFLS